MAQPRRRRKRRRLNPRFVFLVATLAVLLVLLISVIVSCSQKQPGNIHGSV